MSFFFNLNSRTFNENFKKNTSLIFLQQYFSRGGRKKISEKY